MSRLSRLQEAMRREGIDVAVVGPSSHLRYLLGYEAFALDRLTILLCTPDSAVMVIPDFDADEFVEISGFDRVVRWTDKDGHAEALRSAVESLDLTQGTTWAIDDALAFGFFLHLQEYIDEALRTRLDPLLMPLRMVKDPDEQAKMAEAGDVVSRGLDFALSSLRPGRTELDLARDIESRLRSDGADSVALVFVAKGATSVAPHHKPTNETLEKGDSVAICIVARVGGYLSDISQHAFLGPPSTDYASAYEAVWAAEQATIDAIKPGVVAEELEAVAFSVIDDAGFGKWFGVRTGHGIGIDIVEPPSLWAGDTTELIPGVATIVGPGVYVPDAFGIRIDDTVIVDDDGARILTRASRPLTIID